MRNLGFLLAMLCCVCSTGWANDIRVTNLRLTGQNTSSGTNDAANFSLIKFDLSWNNSWRHDSPSGELSYIGVKTTGNGYTGANVYIGSTGRTLFASNTAVNRGDLLYTNTTPIRYYVVTVAGTTHVSTVPSHTSSTAVNGTATLQFVSISDGGGSGATASATISNNKVIAFSITNAGSGYTSIPTVTVAATGGTITAEASADAFIHSWWDAAWVYVKFRVGASDFTFSNVTVTSGSNTITLSSVAGLRVGMPIFLYGGSASFSNPVFITNINSGTNQITVSQNAGGSTSSNNTVQIHRIWEHAFLNNTGHSAAPGSTIDPGLLTPGSAFNATTNPALGVFVYRSSAGTGNNSFNGIQLRWNYGENGIRDTDQVQVDVMAVEMVYVPQCSFFVGTGGSEYRSLTNGSWISGFVPPAPSIPLQITSESALGIDNASGKIWVSSTDQSANGTRLGIAAADPEVTLAAAYPKGFAAIYCMKYEMSQGQFRDFLNKLPYAHQRVFCHTPNNLYSANQLIHSSLTGNPQLGARNGLKVRVAAPLVGGAYYGPAVLGCDLNNNNAYNESTDGENLPCNFLAWTDLAGFLDWAALRPMTELEFDKIARGPQVPVPDEYAWGNTVIAQASGIANSGSGSEVANAGENAAYNNHASVPGPLRTGAFAALAASRTEAGASYWGLMEFSGNLAEQVVIIGNNAGRSFTGVHGNGRLFRSGNADVDFWPGINGNSTATTANTAFMGTTGITQWTGSGQKCGGFSNVMDRLEINDREFGWSGFNNTSRQANAGGRGVRTAP